MDRVSCRNIPGFTVFVRVAHVHAPWRNPLFHLDTDGRVVYRRAARSTLVPHHPPGLFPLYHYWKHAGTTGKKTDGKYQRKTPAQAICRQTRPRSFRGIHPGSKKPTEPGLQDNRPRGRHGREPFRPLGIREPDVWHEFQPLPEPPATERTRRTPFTAFRRGQKHQFPDRQSRV